MVLAAQCALDCHFIVHEDHAAVAADIMEYLDLILLVAQDDQWQTHEFDRFDIALLRQVARKPETCPAFTEYMIAFVDQEFVAGISLVGQSICLFDWLQDCLKGDARCRGLVHGYYPQYQARYMNGHFQK